MKIKRQWATDKYNIMGKFQKRYTKWKKRYKNFKIYDPFILIFKKAKTYWQKGDHWLPGNDIVGKELTEKRQEETFEVMKMF